ncbi:hypothetical protein [uncultured Anaerococcus sp.]|uniref:hypothetical protein n=1 Tax=uncultured Anaerococcus sp. TaxID=293428 RepID=UPI0025F26E20|nr:hypothetical protein [uncultured Anaerococcus sp.]
MIETKDVINEIIYANGDDNEEITTSWNENLDKKFEWTTDTNSKAEETLSHKNRGRAR